MHITNKLVIIFQDENSWGFGWSNSCGSGKFSNSYIIVYEYFGLYVEM